MQLKPKVLSTDNLYQIALGAGALTVSNDQCSRTATLLAAFLENHPAVGAVHYPGLPAQPQHHIANRLFKTPSWLLAFEIKQMDTMLELINSLSIPVKATRLGDSRTLIFPVAPTIEWEAGLEVRADMGVADGMRESVGLEEEAELLADFEQALTP